MGIVSDEWCAWLEIVLGTPIFTCFSNFNVAQKMVYLPHVDATYCKKLSEGGAKSYNIN